MKSLTLRLWSLAAVVGIGFTSVFLLPKTGAMHLSKMKSEMPAELDDWEGQSVPVSERELSVLAADTIFERRIYTKPYDRTRPHVEASLVFSGKDMNSSIHRPEVCLRTQGWNFVHERYVDLPNILPGGNHLTVREIVCKKTRRDPETGDPVTLPSGEILEDWQMLYYTFVGSTSTTASHYGRVLIDIKDRVVGGFDQQWAYATFSTVIPGKYAEQKVDIGGMDPLDVEDTGKYIADFMRELMPFIIRNQSEAGTVRTNNAE